MGKTEVTFCQYKSCKGCRQRSICNVKRGGPKPEVKTRTCKYCGFVNSIDDMNCKKCDAPLVI